MTLIIQSTVIFLSFCVLTRCHGVEVCFSDYCEFHLTISFGEIMTKMEEGEMESYLTVTEDCVQVNGTCVRVKEVPTLEEASRTFQTGGKDLITGDGHRRRIILINGQFPGPTIEVGHNSQVVVHVHNELATVGTAIHWHGMRMKDTPWMDGVTFITQCPILPYQTFTYNFKASPAGTHWYHSHLGNQRRDGIYGMLVVHETPPKMPAFPLIVQDWYHVEGFTERPSHLLLMKEGEEPAPVSALINGRKALTSENNPELLLDTITTFRVTKGEEYRFRTLNPGGDLPYEVSIDNHQLLVVALDGIDIVPITVDSFVIYAGERVDFVLSTDQPAASYWLRANPIEIHGDEHGEEEEEEEDPEAVKVKALIVYDNLATVLPTSTQQLCTATKTCTILNCAFRPPPDMNKQCIRVADVRSIKPLPEDLGPNAKVTEKFFNVGDNWSDSINSKRHILPQAPLYPICPRANDGIVNCSKVCIDISKGCECTHLVKLPYDAAIQIVLTNLEPPSIALHAGHPMHIHGHHFAVVSQGFGEFDTGMNTSDNQDVICESPLCKDVVWAREPPKFNLIDPPMKDTVVVPPGGYVVLRFRSDNPGFWFVHCHILFDMIEGMALILKVAPDLLPPTPSGFPKCFPFNQNLTSIEEGVPQSQETCETSCKPEMPTTEGKCECPECKSPDEESQEDGNVRMAMKSFVGIILGSVAIGAVLTSCPLLCLLLYRMKGKNVQGSNS